MHATSEMALGRNSATVPLIGDSHSFAVHEAVERRRAQGMLSPVEVFRRDRKETRTEEERAKLDDARNQDWTWRGLAGITMEDFLARVSDLGPEDFVLSTLAGSEYVYYGMLKHPIPFDFCTPSQRSAAIAGTQLIPYRAIADAFFKTAAKRYANLFAIREATRARVVHLLSPPPISDDDFIERTRKELSRRAGIPNLPVAPALLRMKFYDLQTSYLSKVCQKRGIELMLPPAEAMQDGFLDPKCYASDAHHGNALYGELVLRDVEKRVAMDD